MADYGTKLTGFTFSNFTGENLSAHDWNTVIGTDANVLAMMVAQRDRVTQSSDRVSLWDDRSDNNMDATQATSGNQPRSSTTCSAPSPRSASTAPVLTVWRRP